MRIETPYLKILYNDKNISADLSKSLLSFTYTDSLEDADILDIEVEDSETKWQSTWYPDKGAILKVEMGNDVNYIDCGAFEIDEIEFLGPPDTLLIRAIAAGFTEGKKRTNKSHVHESKTLSEIIRTVAAGLGLQVVGKISDIRIARKVQRQERDLRFLSRLAREYGYNFNVRDDKAIFVALSELEENEAVAIFKKSDLINFSIKDKSTNTYKSASVRFLNPKTGETVHFEEEEKEIQVHTDDQLQLKLTAQSEAEARLLTKAALNAANKLQQSGSITLPGSPFLISGNIIRLEGLGNLSGDYLIRQAAHTISNGEGWIADLEIYKVGYKEDKKQTPTSSSKGKQLTADEAWYQNT